MKRSGAESAELYIYSEIDSSGVYGVSARDVVKALGELKGVKSLDVRINSGGGDVFDGIAIYEALRRFPGNVHVYVDGLAASAASVIAMAGNTRSISLGGFFMVHKASGLVYGNDEDMRAMADILENITNQIGNIYAERTGVSYDDVRPMIAAETWLNAEDSLKNGFATEIIYDAGATAVSRDAMTAKLENAKKAFSSGVKMKATLLMAPQTSAATPPPEPDRDDADQSSNQPPQSEAFLISNNLNQKRSDPMNREAVLRENLETATIKAEQIKNDATQASRGLTPDEIKAIKELKGEMDSIEAELEALKIVNDATQRLAAPQPRKEAIAPASKPAANATTVIGSVAAKRTDGGFTGGFSEFATAVRNVFTGGNRDERLFRNTETTFGSGGVGAEGGFAIPEDFRREIQSNAIDQDPLIQRVYQLPTNSRQVTLPTHESQPWASDSLQSYFTGEGAAATRSKFAMNQVTIQLYKATVFTLVTEEMLEDAPALQTAIGRDAASKLNFAVSHSIVRGSGVNQPLGFLNAPSLVTVAKETAGSAQTADTITVENVTKMYAAMPARNRGNAVWLVHPDAEAQLWQGKWHASAEPIGYAPGTLPNQPFGVLFGRPVIPHEVCETVGDLGDIIFVDLSQYALPMKQGGIRSATSMHLAFDQDLMAFKWSIRFGGAPLWQGPIDSRDGTFDRGPFVALAAR